MRRSFALALSVACLVAAPAAAQDVARYRLELVIEWSAATHPLDWPADAHLSDPIGALHGPRYTLFADGRTASSGLALVAENGRAAVLEAELAEAIRPKRVAAVFRAEGLARVPGVIATEIEATAERPLLSVVTMLAPSPDWFTGLAGVDLRPGGRWLDRLEAPLWAWDAGSDSGATYAAEDAETQPRQSVRLLAAPHVLGSAGLARIGLARLTRLP